METTKCAERKFCLVFRCNGVDAKTSHLSSSFGLVGLFGTSSGPIKPQQVAGTSVPLYRPLLVVLGGPISKFLCETCDNVYTMKDNLEKHIGRQTIKQQRRTQLNLNKFGEHLCPRPLLLAFDSADSETTAENLWRLTIEKCHTFRMLSKPAWLSLSKMAQF